MPDPNDQTTREGATEADWSREEAYWREQHHKQPYADKNRPYEHYEPAYRVAVEGADKYAGKSYDEVEESLATDYQHAEPGSPLPWDTVRPAARAAWDRLAGLISPRDSDRGIRGSI